MIVALIVYLYKLFIISFYLIITLNIAAPCLFSVYGKYNWKLLHIANWSVKTDVHFESLKMAFINEMYTQYILSQWKEYYADLISILSL